MSRWARVIVGLAILTVLVVWAIRVSRPAPQTHLAPLAPAIAEPIPTRVPQPQVESRIFHVAEATGRVEVSRNGKWEPVASGDVLTQQDIVRTGAGHTVLKLGGAEGLTEVELRDRVEIRLGVVSGAGAQLDLRRGKVVARVGRSGDNLAITAAKARAQNQGAAPARFIVTADDRGRVSVAATEGAVSFASGGKTITVPAGTVSRAQEDAPPADPEKIAEDVFLSVVWPSGERREEKLPLAGAVAPGSTVRINGTPATVDENGRFTATIPMREGKNAIQVEVDDVAGRTKTETREIHKIPTRAPELEPVRTELWKQ